MQTKAKTGLFPAVWMAVALPAGYAEEARRDPSPLELFEDRILPIFKSPDPSSCVQCHLSAVDLKDYILPSPERTFASLRDQGLIDPERPGESKILRLIRMGERDRDEGARLLHAKTRQAEYDAFAAWIKACCADPAFRKLPEAAPEDRARPSRPDPVIRHARKSRVVDAFARKIWSQRMRCFPCHTPYELDENNPKHRRPIERVREFREEYGDDLAARLRIFRETPESTLDYLIADSLETPSDRLPLINLENPQKSLLVLKPTSKLPRKVDGVREKPSYVEPVSHMGGLKMHLDDPSYKSFVSWIEDYAKVVGDRYRSVEELPGDNWQATKHVIVLENVPDDWPPHARVQLFLHSWNSRLGSWSDEPVAFTQNSVTPRRRVVGALFLLRPLVPSSSSPSHPTANGRLAPGKYLVKACLDSRRRLAEEPTAMLGKEDFYGQVSIDARWREGFRQAQKIDGRLLEKEGP